MADYRGCREYIPPFTLQWSVSLGRCHFDRENSNVHGMLIFNIIFKGISMIYTVKQIDEDLDFGCEE